MISRSFLIFLLFLTGLSNNKTFGQPDQKGDLPGRTQSIQLIRVSIDSIANPRYTRSFQGPGGNIFIQGQVEIKKEKDGQYVVSPLATSLFPSEAIKEGAMNSFYSWPGFFIALSYGEMIQPAGDRNNSLSTLMPVTIRGVADLPSPQRAMRITGRPGILRIMGTGAGILRSFRLNRMF